MTTRTLGAHLKHLRQAKKLTQNDLASQLHVSRQTISSWETDRNQPDLTTIQQLANFYQVSLDTLVADRPADKMMTTKPQRAIVVIWALLAVLTIERITQMSTFSGYHWVDFLWCWLIGLLGVSWWSKRHHSSRTTTYLVAGGLLIFAGLGITSGLVNAFDMGFGLTNTCFLSGVVALITAIISIRRQRQTN
ncbi:helix-turn-helix domain-containing protein [Lactiplantibacillus mudanjiangensis]|uniref:Transcriptional regulator, xre family [Lactobacillus paracasei ATCC 334] n=1 Tax=Lactiplantibacillus mudanjiangensis TaxID=1296538 RepID=A0A660E806_9LACO|nr:helix-turn-helix transcriptional regulator [Lactiplantibacillus mudanjiangensis]VDG18058.1 Transcriptional regulator, xre family [Lactobacillus paracasei ATCC 334] [Lactiplantibacillus mudanjiangensis]VDG24772.1 Transcriptional regulator, xre family [Lactobacillus paracasei ATCC 334] [Lactiplantibacillus mudanjiangensis]VDG28479.1 Transcriptional regulator, xre family [Lactobacillus paracasei ATCC 334] [Lactiplantibacillus mudanjiangensis]VDG32243.1 Transcriptional regulator, xre family [Lac